MNDFTKKMKEEKAVPIIDWLKIFHLGLGLALVAKGFSFLYRE